MSRFVRVQVPGTRVLDPLAGTTAAATHWLRASFAIDASSTETLVRGGTLAELTSPASDDYVLRGFRAACAVTDSAPPAALRIRAVSEIPLAVGAGAAAAATVAGIVGARALLNLALEDDAAARLAVGLDGDAGRVAASLAGHRCAVAVTCDDDFASNDQRDLGDERKP